MRVTLLSRASDLARLQAGLVGDALTARWPDLDIHYLTRTATGDRDAATPLTAFADKGAFTADLSEALDTGAADIVVHSWKDLPVEERAGSRVVATLSRADPRDVLLIRRDVVQQRPRTLTLLSSSPRRVWLLKGALASLLPWRVDDVQDVPVRGNVPTRLRRLIERRADGLVVAKAALDRLLDPDSPYAESRAAVRDAISQCEWMVLPIKEHPSAPAQGALAIEVATAASAIADRVRAINHAPTWTAVLREREILAAHGGGCHAALGATVLPREYGSVTSARARRPDGSSVVTWSLDRVATEPPRASVTRMWPRADERERANRHPLPAEPPPADTGLWVSRAEALPESWRLTADRLVWVAGSRTWLRLAARGVWVHGSAEGLGDTELPSIDALAGRTVTWRRLTNERAAELFPDAIATYVVNDALPADLATRTHFFWSSGSSFLEAIRRSPAILDKWHACGPGQTWRMVRAALGPEANVSVWLDYEQWREAVQS